jgi:hypothetical protein
LPVVREPPRRRNDHSVRPSVVPRGDAPMSGHTTYGFVWGPMEVQRVAHIEGRGYCVEVKGSGGQSVQVLVSEKGRRVTAYPVNGAKCRDGDAT